MNDVSSVPTRVVYVGSLVAILGTAIVLVGGFIEPFNGTSAGLVGRMLGAVGIMLFSLSNLWRGRGRTALLWIGLAVGVVGLIVAVLGRVR